MRGYNIRRKAALLFAFIFALPAHAEPLAVGDFVFRAGTGRESALIRHASHSAWSHIGIVIAVEPDIHILHATTDDDPEYPNQVIVSSYAEFSAPQLAERTAIARPLFLSPAERETLAANLRAQIGQPFILAARDQSPRYCTTILFDALETLHPDLPLRWQTTTLPLFQGEYLFPQAFAELPELQWITQNP